MNISVVISAFNEEDLIQDCLKSVKWANEIIFINNQSTDRTVEIATKFTDKIYSRPNNPSMLNLNKNFGFTKAKSDWILSLDADERVSKNLKREIVNRLKQDKKTVGYLIPRKNIIFGKWIQHGLWYPDYQLRLFKRGKGKFPGKHNHELLKVKGETQKLTNHIIHYNYNSVNQYLNKIAYYYSDNEVTNFLKKGKKLYWSDAIRMPASDFLTNFFAREGFKDGLHGLVLALLQSFYSLVVFAKVWEKQGFWEYDSEDFLDQIKKEISLKRKELIYWLMKVTSQEKNYPARMLDKLKSKLGS